MKKIIKLLTNTLSLAFLLLSTGCDKTKTFDNQNIAIVKQDGVVESTTSITISASYLGGLLDINIPINNPSPQSQGFLTIGLVNIATDPNFATNKTITLPINNSNEAVSLDYKNYFTDPANGSTSLKEFSYYSTKLRTSPVSGSILITKNDLNAKRIEGIIQDCVLYDGDLKVTIDCQFFISY